MSKAVINPEAISSLASGVADAKKMVKRAAGLKTHTISGFGNYNIAIASSFVSGIGTSVFVVQTAGNGNATITHIAGTQNATSSLSATNSNGTLTVTTTAELFTMTFMNATMIT